MEEIERRLIDRAGNAPVSRPTPDAPRAPEARPSRASGDGAPTASAISMPDPQVEALIRKFRK